MTDQVTIKLGESGASYLTRYPDKIRVNHQPAGLDFYTIRWSKKPRGAARIEHGSHSFSIDNVLSISTAEDQADLKPEGLFEFSINAGVTDTEFIDHDEARLKTHAILRRILDAGWRPIVLRGTARLSGQARLDAVLNVTDEIGLDARHLPTLEEWMRIPNMTGWPLYADGVFMDISFQRQPNPANAEKSGAYLLTFIVKTEAEYYRNYLKSVDRVRWKEVLPEVMLRQEKYRADEEAKIRDLGIAIDETYRDPPLPSFDE